MSDDSDPQPDTDRRKLPKNDFTDPDAFAGDDTLGRLKRAFTEVVSHELNTPVAIIVGYTSLLKRQFRQSNSEDEITERALEGLDVATERLESISTRIFKLLSDGGRISNLQLENIEIRSFLNALHRQLQGFLDARSQQLEIDIAADVPNSLSADPDKLHDILLNLLMNAIKFSRDEQNIELLVRGDDSWGRDFDTVFADAAESDETSHRDNDERVYFVVRDMGTGIDDDDIDQVFDAFFSTFQSRHHSSGEFEFGKRGIGLGLPVARRFARMHGGDISVESEPGEGSRFTVMLPTAPHASSPSD